MARKSKKKHTSMRAYNPEQWQAEMTELAAQSPADAAEVAGVWRERFQNMMSEGAETTQRALHILIAGGSAFVMAGWDGDAEAVKNSEIAQWMGSPDATAAAAEAGVDVTETSPYVHGDELDPTAYILGIPNILLGTLFLTVIAVFFKNKYTPFVESAALGSAAYWAGSKGFEIFHDRREEAIAAEGLSQAA